MLYLFNFVGVVLRKKLSPEAHSPFLLPSEGFLRYVTRGTIQVKVLVAFLIMFRISQLFAAQFYLNFVQNVFC